MRTKVGKESNKFTQLSVRFTGFGLGTFSQRWLSSTKLIHCKGWEREERECERIYWCQE